MFNQLLANLPFNPSLVNQLAFYGRRLKAESSIRRIGFVFVALTLVIQVIAVISTPQFTQASSTNDLINGGISSNTEAYSDCQKNNPAIAPDYGTILSYYGVACSDVEIAATIQLTSTDYSHELYSMGRLPYNLKGETPVSINNTTYYWRYLWAWDTTSTPSVYNALKFATKSGDTFFILYSCGNLVHVGLPTPQPSPTPYIHIPTPPTPPNPISPNPTPSPTPKPTSTPPNHTTIPSPTPSPSPIPTTQPTPSPSPTSQPKSTPLPSPIPNPPSPITATTLKPNFIFWKATSPGYPEAGSFVKPGEIISYRLYFSNYGGKATQVAITDPIPVNTTYYWMGSGSAKYHMFTPATSFAPSQLGYAYWLWPTVQGNLNNYYYVDLKVKINNNVASGTNICNVATITSAETPLHNSNRLCDTVENSPTPTTPKPTVTPTITTTPTPPPASTVPPSTPPITPTTTTPCQYNTSIPSSSPQCKPCFSSQTQADILSCLTYAKAATNITQNIANANGATAQPGDIIQYTLSVTNSASATANNVIIQDDLTDVLDYSRLLNTNGANPINTTTSTLSWPAVNIPAGSTVAKTFTVQILNPIPTTLPSPSNPTYFNHTLTNTYGNTIVIHLPITAVLASAQVSQALPNTGPGSDLLIAGAVMIFVGYFFARARLLAKEAVLVTSDYTTSKEL